MTSLFVRGPVCRRAVVQSYCIFSPRPYLRPNSTSSSGATASASRNYRTSTRGGSNRRVVPSEVEIRHEYARSYYAERKARLAEIEEEIASLSPSAPTESSGEGESAEATPNKPRNGPSSSSAKLSPLATAYLNVLSAKESLQSKKDSVTPLRRRKKKGTEQVWWQKHEQSGEIVDKLNKEWLNENKDLLLLRLNKRLLVKRLLATKPNLSSKEDP